jgi:4-diphosphocytidyl-2-C-methyl-D-erythritol kinase
MKGDVWRGSAPAKVNLFLRVLAREETGYHQIETLFQALELSDGVAVERTDGFGIELEVEGVAPGVLGPDDENLAVRAARAYLGSVSDIQGADGGWRIHLAKRIPHGAGLGGGSSDAAAVLRGLDALHGNRVGTEGLVRIGARLGADVGFFVLDRALALGWGRGDRLLPLDPLPPREVVLALPPFRIDTAWAYRTLAQEREATGREGPGGGVIDLHRLRSWDGVAGWAENAFQAALAQAHPELGRLVDELTRAEAELALLSGSGCAVFGVFADAEAADRAAAAMDGSGAAERVIRTRTLGG